MAATRKYRNKQPCKKKHIELMRKCQDYCIKPYSIVKSIYNITSG